MTYVAPVKLYIFISFIVFFIPALLPDSDKIKEDVKRQNFAENVKLRSFIEQMQRAGVENQSHWIERYERELHAEKLFAKIIHDIPKAIFVYMPFFAFWLWVFHDKQKRFYFDHGIFTLHYFSFILLGILLLILLRNFLVIFFTAGDTWAGFVSTAVIGYFIYYFFHSHRLVYRESKAVSRLKCSLLFIINTICILVFLVSFIVLEAYTMGIKLSDINNWSRILN